MTDNFTLINATTSEEYLAGKQLYREYAASLDFSLCFQDLDKEIVDIDVQYNKPYGTLILVKSNDQYVGCAGIRHYENRIAELKRMYVKPEFRCHGLGRRMLDAAVSFCIRAGYEYIRLDTMRSMQEAIRIYTEYGFYEIEPYRYNPCKDALYMEKKLW